MIMPGHDEVMTGVPLVMADKQRAKRLARTIQRWKDAGETRPYIAPVPKTHLLPAALGLVSGGLTVQLIAALCDWPNDDTS